MKKNIVKAATPLMLALTLSYACTRTEVKVAAPEKTETAKIDAPPLELSVRLLPEGPGTGALLRAVAEASNGQIDGLSFRWERNSEPIEGNADSVVTTGFKKGDRIKVIAASGGEEASAETELVNTLPVMRAIRIGPRPFRTGTDIKADPEAYDADGDRVSYEYRWYVNKERLYSEGGATLSSKNYRRGDRVRVVVTPFDGESKGDPLEADAGSALNSPPVFASAPPMEFSGTFVYEPKLLDEDGDAPAVVLTKGPEGMRLEDGRVEWDARGKDGSFEVVLTADDGSGGQARQSFEVKVGR